MNFMAKKNRYTFLKVIAGVLALAVFGAGGFALGMRYKTENVVSALPRVTGEKISIDSPEDTQTEKEENSVFIGKSSESGAGSGTWTTVDSANYDITGDGVNDTITLYTSAESDSSGIMWDDRQQWVLEVSDGTGGYYTLASESISNGYLYYETAERTDGKRSVIVYESTGSGTNIKEYIFSRAGFEESAVYNSNSMNKVHSSIPTYK